jgi:outer membrane protein assembly factor BamB
VWRAGTLGAILVSLFALAGCDPPSRFGALAHQWDYQTGDTIAATPAIMYQTVFVGSWDGYEYALNQSNASLRWRRYLGQTHDNCPGDTTTGVTSKPAFVDGTAYLGGGDSNWYAVNSISGNVLWTVPTGDNGPNAGHYNWSSPAVLNGYAYVGISSLCDSPLVQGELLRVNLATHQVQNVWKVVPDGQVGGAIWTSPVVDAARNTVYVTTGNKAYDSTGNTQQYAESLVALDATTLAVKSHWRLPLNEPTPDSDWGTSPTFFRDSQGRDLVSAANKNGILYAFRRDDVGAGPVWFYPIADPAAGTDPGAGGAYSNGYFDGQRLYYAGARTKVGGNTVDGSVRALDPATGHVIWETPLPDRTFGALTAVNGMLVIPSIDGLRLLDATTGDVLYGNEMILYAGAATDSGIVYIGDFRGVMHALKFPSSTAQARASAASVAAFSCRTPRSAGSVLAGCRLSVARGCHSLEGLKTRWRGRVARRLVVRRVGAPQSPPARIRLYAGTSCSGRPLFRKTLRGRRFVLPVPEAYQLMPPGSVLSVATSRPVRLRISIEGASDG